jgi:hypothetical protein
VLAGQFGATFLLPFKTNLNPSTGVGRLAP